MTSSPHHLISDILPSLVKTQLEVKWKRPLTIPKTHHRDGFPSRRLPITTTHHFDDLPSGRITITTAHHYDDFPFRRITISTTFHYEREVVPVSRHERETVTTSQYNDFALRRRPSIFITFHYDETFLTRSPRHRRCSGGGRFWLQNRFVSIPLSNNDVVDHFAPLLAPFLLVLIILCFQDTKICWFFLYKINIRKVWKRNIKTLLEIFAKGCRLCIL